MNVQTDPRLAAQEEIRAVRARIQQLDEAGIELLFTKARSHYAWTDRPVSDALLRRLYDITALGATSMNTSPARFIFVTTDEGRQQIAPALKPKNLPKVMDAPVTVIIAQDLSFWERLDYLFPHENRKPMFEGKDAHIQDTAFRNATLQGAYMMLAARALGLDCGPMSGFDNKVIDDTILKGTTLKSNFLLNLGYADESALFQKLPRLPFEEACSFM